MKPVSTRVEGAESGEAEVGGVKVTVLACPPIQGSGSKRWTSCEEYSFKPIRRIGPKRLHRRLRSSSCTSTTKPSRKRANEIEVDGGWEGWMENRLDGFGRQKAGEDPS